MTKYVIELVEFKFGIPTRVDGKIIHVERLVENDNPDSDADWVAVCIVEKGEY